jgi:transposase-like protein
MLLRASSVCGLFKWRQFGPTVILLAVGSYLRFSLSYRDLEELLAERGLRAAHVTVWRWGPTLSPRNSAPIATAAPTDQRQLAGGRDLHPG